MNNRNGNSRFTTWVWRIVSYGGMIAFVLLCIWAAGQLAGCSLHIHYATKHYHGAETKKQSAEERILNAFGVSDEAEADSVR